MRKILFRGKPSGNAWITDWVYGAFCPINSKGDNPCIMLYDERFKGHRVEIDSETVGQYTGLTDKNGTKIFEGDIFKFSDEIFESYYTSCGTEYNSWEVENYGVVGFCEYFGKFDFIKYKFNENAVEADLHENHNIEFYEFVSDLEIIGNIHDNPELIEGDKDNG